MDHRNSRKYTPEEAESIELVESKRPRVPVGKALSGPLQNFVREIALITVARKRFENAFEHLGGERWDPEVCEPIVSAYLKAWLCNSNPFILAELAQVFTANGQPEEASQTIDAAQKFPEYAKGRKLEPYSLIAQKVVFDLFPSGLVGRDTRSREEGLFSARAISALNDELERCRNKIEELRDRVMREPNPFWDQIDQAIRSATEVGAKPVVEENPSPQRVKEVWEAWEKGERQVFWNSSKIGKRVYQPQSILLFPSTLKTIQNSSSLNPNNLA